MTNIMELEKLLFEVKTICYLIFMVQFIMMIFTAMIWWGSSIIFNYLMDMKKEGDPKHWLR